jgi:hypothetical protein
MPNWCYNQLQLFGPEEEIVRFFIENVDAEPLSDSDVNRRVQLGEGSDESTRCCLSFSKSVPSLVACDNELCNVESHSAPLWYCANIKYWGTKWEPRCCKVSVDRKHYTFDTAYDAPLNWLKSVAALYPAITFTLTYEEPGIGFTDALTVKGRLVLDEHRDEMHDDDDDDDEDN